MKNGMGKPNVFTQKNVKSQCNPNILYITDLSNAELLRICAHHIGDNNPIFDIDITNEKILCMAQECNRYLKEKQPNVMDAIEAASIEKVTTFAKTLSGRQMHCASLAGIHAARGEFKHAFHEFMDVVDDYGEGRKSDRGMSLTEYSMYICLLDMIIAGIEYTNEKKDIGMKIVAIRGITGLSQREFCQEYNIPLSTLRKWEQGVSSCPSYIIELLEYKITTQQKESENNG